MAISNSMLALTIAIVVVLSAVAVYSAISPNHSTTTTTSSSSSSTSQSTIQGIIAGYVTVGPSQPVCRTNESCNVDLTGYSLLFASQCGTAASSVQTSSSCQSQAYSAQIAPSGHFSILLSPGNYTVTGLSPACSWVGCSTTFPKVVTVEPGQQSVININIDTGIR